MRFKIFKRVGGGQVIVNLDRIVQIWPAQPDGDTCVIYFEGEEQVDVEMSFAQMSATLN